MPKRILSKPVSCLGAGLIVLAAPNGFAVDPANYKAGPVLLTPTVDMQVGYTDNLFRADRNEKDTGFSVASPRVQAWLENEFDTYSLAYELVDYRYFDSSDDDFTDHMFNLDVHQEFNARNRADLYAEYWAGHEDRGTGLTEGLAQALPKPIELDRSTLGGDYTYGSELSRGRLKLAGKYLDHQYQNFEDITRYRDRDRYEFNTTFLWAIAPRTSALVQARYIDTGYDHVLVTDPSGSLDSEEMDYLLGVTWDATAKTSGSVRVGMFEREYDSGARRDDDGFSWEIDLNYRPRTYSWFNLQSRRYYNEPNGLGDGIDTSEATLSWSHDWNTRSSTHLAFVLGVEDYAGVPRDDDHYGLDTSYTFAQRRWLDWGVGYRFEDRDSNVDQFDFNRNEVYIEAEISL